MALNPYNPVWVDMDEAHDDIYKAGMRARVAGEWLGVITDTTTADGEYDGESTRYYPPTVTVRFDPDKDHGADEAEDTYSFDEVEVYRHEFNAAFKARLAKIKTLWSERGLDTSVLDKHGLNLTD